MDFNNTFQSDMDNGADYSTAGLNQQQGNGGMDNSTVATTNIGQQLFYQQQQQQQARSGFPQLQLGVLSSGSFSTPSSTFTSSLPGLTAQQGAALNALAASPAAAAFFHQAPSSSANLFPQQNVTSQSSQAANFFPGLLSQFTNAAGGVNSASGLAFLQQQQQPSIEQLQQFRRQAMNTQQQIALGQQGDYNNQGMMYAHNTAGLPMIAGGIPSAHAQPTGVSASGMMIFHDKMTGKNFLVPTGPTAGPSPSPSGSASASEGKLPPLPEVAENLVADQKPDLDVSDFLNIPPKQMQPQNMVLGNQHAQRGSSQNQVSPRASQHNQISPRANHHQQQQHPQQQQQASPRRNQQAVIRTNQQAAARAAQAQANRMNQQQTPVLQQQTSVRFEAISEDEADNNHQKDLRFETISDTEEGTSLKSAKRPALTQCEKTLQKALEDQIGDLGPADDWANAEDALLPTNAANPEMPGSVKINVKVTSNRVNSQVVQPGSEYNIDEEGETGEDDEEIEGPSDSVKSVMKNEEGNFVVHVEDRQCMVVDGVRKWVCLRCPKQYSSKHNLVTHILGHEGIKPHKCHICFKAFKQLSHLKTHLLRHGNNKQHHCNVCDRSFIQSAHLKRHLATHMTERPHHCLVCRRGFAYPGELRQHVEKAHSNGITGEKLSVPGGSVIVNKPFKCPLCPKQFTGPKQLKKHKQTIHKPVVSKNKELTCKICKQSFLYRSQLRDHVLKHEEFRPYPCPDCDMRFMKEHHLRAHKFTHSGLKPFVCEHCDRAFNQKANLQRHLLIHRATKMYHCRECQKDFSQLQCLKAHMVTHSDVKPYKCNVCQKDFSRSHNLKGHMALHRGGKEFACHCGAAFTLKGNLTRHQKVKHGMSLDNSGTSDDCSVVVQQDQLKADGSADHQEVAHILQDMSSQQPVYHPPASTMLITAEPKTSTADLYNVPASSSTATSTSNYTTGDWSRDLNIAANIMDEALQKNATTGEKKRFLSFEEITAEDSGAVAMKTGEEEEQENVENGV